MRGIISVIVLLFLNPVQATIYGENSLTDIVNTNSQIQNLSKSVAVLMSNNSLRSDFSYSSRTLLNAMVCEDEAFISQPVTSTCSGFLISDKHILTAAHCYSGSPNMCRNTKWVFDYSYNNHIDEILGHHPDNVYGCEKVVQGHYYLGLDYMIIELDRTVTNRAPLKLSTQPEAMNTDYVFSISSPRGLPLKYSEGSMRSIESPYFVTNIDLMRGSSGAPVFNDRHEVIGLVASGDVDYDLQDEPFCNRYMRCGEDECRGEHATSIKDIPFNFESIGLYF